MMLTVASSRLRTLKDTALRVRESCAQKPGGPAVFFCKSSRELGFVFKHPSSHLLQNTPANVCSRQIYLLSVNTLFININTDLYI